MYTWPSVIHVLCVFEGILNKAAGIWCSSRLGPSRRERWTRGGVFFAPSQSRSARKNDFIAILDGCSHTKLYGYFHGPDLFVSSVRHIGTDIFSTRVSDIFITTKCAGVLTLRTVFALKSFNCLLIIIIIMISQLINIIVPFDYIASYVILIVSIIQIFNV